MKSRTLRGSPTLAPITIVSFDGLEVHCTPKVAEAATLGLAAEVEVGTWSSCSPATVLKVLSKLDGLCLILLIPYLALQREMRGARA